MIKIRINKVKFSKIVDFIKEYFKKPDFVFCVVFMLLNCLFTKYILGDTGIKKFMLVIFVELIIEVFVIFIIFRLRKKGVPLEKRFLFLALILGVMFVVILPPGQAPDDVTHFRRAYSLSTGEVMPDLSENNEVFGSMPVEVEYMPIMPSKGTYEKLLNNMDANSGENTDQVYTAAALYNFVCYIPQTIAIWIGKVFNFSILGIGYLVKIFNFLTWTMLVFFAIKVIPKFKKVVVFIALLPITMQEATSMSPDALTIGLSILLVSFVMFLAYGRKRSVTGKDLSILYVMACAIGLCKIVYLPLVLLCLIIPAVKFGSKKRKIIHLSIIFALVVVINLAWLILSSKYLVEYNEGVDSGIQLKNILQNPINYLEVVFGTMNIYMQSWVSNMLGLSLGAFVFNLPGMFFFLSFAIMLLLFFQRSDTLKMGTVDRFVFTSVFLIIFCLILTSLYMQWTPVGYNFVEGVQGRYFLPILLLVPIIISRRGDKKPHMNLITQDTVLIYSLFVNVIALLTIFVQNV